MPVHDWTRGNEDSFNDFHQTWLVLLKGRLNRGLLPDGYYSHIERHDGRFTPELLVAGPRTMHKTHRSTVAVRHVGTRRLVAVIELASVASKASASNVGTHVEKMRAVLEAGVHVVHLDILPPTGFVPEGLTSAIWNAVSGTHFLSEHGKQCSVDSFSCGDVVELYANPLAVGDELPDLPLFLSEEAYIPLPLLRTYAEAFASTAPHDRRLLTRPA